MICFMLIYLNIFSEIVTYDNIICNNYFKIQLYKRKIVSVHTNRSYPYITIFFILTHT